VKRQKRNIAELSHPNQAEQEHARAKAKGKFKKPPGRKRVHLAQDAVYTNWFTPFLWCQIEAAAKDPSVGHQMGSWKIQNVLRKRAPQSFKHI
jgi:hypothetical protein